MSYAWQLNQDDTHSVSIVTYSGNVINKTLAEVKQLVSNAGFNCAILTATNYYYSTNSYMIFTNFGNVDSDLYLASNTYLSDSENEKIGYSFPNTTGFTQYQCYVLANDGESLRQITGTVFNNFSEPVVVSNVTYQKVKHTEQTSTIPPIFITTYDGNIYIDGVLPSKVIATGRTSQNGYVRLIIGSNTDVIYNNSDPTKYRTFVGSSGTVKAYNSAFWHRSSNTQYLMNILLSKSDTLVLQTSSDGVNWSHSASTPMTTLFNNVYSNGANPVVTDGYYSINFALNGWVNITTDIPVFETGSEYNAYMSNLYIPAIIANGGGATHIAKVTGQLKDLSSNLSDILLVSGGGGGGLLVGEDAYAGADAGGISGSGSNSGNQSSGYAFGQGESGSGVSGGGGGFYGGYKGVSA